jgi:hypothetical protein
VVFTAIVAAGMGLMVAVCDWLLMAWLQVVELASVTEVNV